MVDRIAPKVSFKGLVANQTLSGEYLFEVIATDANGIRNVDLFVDGHYWLTEKYYKYTFNLNTLDFADGTHVIKAVAYDKSARHNAGEASITVQIKNTVTPAPQPAPTPEPVPIPTEPPLVEGLLYDAFTKTYSLADNQKSPDGLWWCEYAGYGTVKSENGVMHLTPKAATSTSTTNPDGSTSGTHSCLVHSTKKVINNYSFEVTMATLKQTSIRTPNAWEVAWIFFKHIANIRHYYFMIKSNGHYELGKKDNLAGDTYPEHQIFLAEGALPAGLTFGLGKQYKTKVILVGNVITIYVNGILVVKYTDTSQTEMMRTQEGCVSLYTEDADVTFDNVGITALT